MVLDWYSNVFSLLLTIISGLTLSVNRQNNVVELYSLIKFLRIKPLSNWDVFNEQIGKPVQNGRGAGTAMKRLQVLLDVYHSGRL